MDQWLTLVLPPGAETAAISHGTREFKSFRADHLDPSSLWLARMPPDVAEHYLRGNTGFYLMPEQAMSDTPETVRMRNAEGGSCGWGGVAYEPDRRGIVKVPAAAVGDLLPHGFRPVPDEIADDVAGDPEAALAPWPDPERLDPFEPRDFTDATEPESGADESTQTNANRGHKIKRAA